MVRAAAGHRVLDSPVRLRYLSYSARKGVWVRQQRA